MQLLAALMQVESRSVANAPDCSKQRDYSYSVVSFLDDYTGEGQ
jgi:hypothetical protein